MSGLATSKNMTSSLGTVVLHVALASACLVRAHPAAAEQIPAAEAPKGEVPGRHALRRVTGHSLDEHVRLLTQRLDLDARQQAALRTLLVSQHEQVKQIWADVSMPAADHVSATRAITDRTGDQIRAMLTDEQKAKFGAAHPRRDAEKSAHPDVDYWLRLTSPRAAKDAKTAN
jgi:Spy/CpxP family protein refolding chaperone